MDQQTTHAGNSSRLQMMKCFVDRWCRYLVFISILSLFLTGCRKEDSNLEPVSTSGTVPLAAVSLMTSTPFTGHPTIHVSATSSLLSPDATRLSQEPTNSIRAMTATPAPTATATIDIKEACDPFPDDVSVGPWGFWVVRCDDMVEEVPGEADSRGAWLYYDYTSRTGRLAYGIGIKEEEADYYFKDIELWVYDYWTKTSSRWLSGNISYAKWRPMFYDPLGAQPLAVLRKNGDLVLVTGPNQVYPWAHVGEVHDLTWSPQGDSIAYVRDDVAYVLALGQDQPRKLAEDIYGDIVWAAEGRALIIRAQHIVVIWLDGLETHILKTPDGKIPAPALQTYDDAEYPRIPSGELLWSPENRRLVFSQTIWYCMGCDRVWVYELSQDLQTILTYYSEGCLTDMGCSVYCWLIPGKSVVTNSDHFQVIPDSEAITFRSKAIIYNPEERTMLVGTPQTDEGGSLQTPVDLLFLDKNTEIVSSDGARILLSDFSPSEGLKIEVTCRPIFQISCVASKIRVFDD